LKDQVRDVWSKGVIDAQRVADVVDLIESRLVRDRYFGSRIDNSVETPDADSKRVVFKIQPGVRYDDVRVEFEGVRAVEADELQELLKGSGFFDRDLKKRKQAVPLIENLYKERGYIDVKVDPPRNELNEESQAVRIVFRVTEGPLYRFGEISFDGNAEFTDADLLRRLSIGSEAPFGFKTVQRGQQTLQDLYRKIGYNDVAIQYSQVKDVPKQIVDVTFNIEENYQRILKEVEAEGNRNTSKGLIRSQIALEPGAIVSYDKLGQARSNLYNTGAYSFVEIAVMPLDDRTGLKPNQIAVRLIARVRELQPWLLRYGGFYDTERGPGGIVDISNRNMLGSARVVGVQTRYDSDLHEVRTYFSQPTLHRFPLKSIFTAFQRREIEPDPITLNTVITDRTGFSPSLEYRFHNNSVLMFGYRFEKVHIFEKVPDPIFPYNIRTRVAPLTSSFTRDVRDDPLDASRGRFTSHAFEWGLEKLGSELRYIKYFGQYFAYIPFGKPTTVPWAHTTRNRFVVALGARLGLAKGLGGQDVIRSERFLAGGGTTVRGFEQDHLGPVDPLIGPIGGDAMVVLNSELRFPLYKFFDGVAFVDAGNVYRHLSDFKPFGLRASSGAGLRIRTPYLVLRVDYGFKLSPRPGEPGGKLFFSIGQAF
jgi:outer membrane protein assembly complex protein YaeT